MVGGGKGNLFLAIQVGEEIFTEVGAAVVEAELAVDAADLLHVFVAQLEVSLQVGLDSGWGLGLGEDGVTLCDTPGYIHENGLVGVSFLLGVGG